MSQSQETREAMLNLWVDGKSFTEIGAFFHVTRNIVCGYIKRARERGDVRAAYRNGPPPKRNAPVIKRPAFMRPAKVVKLRPQTRQERNRVRFEEGEDLLPVWKDRQRRPKPAPKPAPVTPPVDPTWATQSMREGGGIGLLDLPFSGMCKWPLGDPRDPGFLYCGASTDEKHVYCVCHRAIAYGRGTPSEQKATSIALRFA